jgi:hypothetical protein
MHTGRTIEELIKLVQRINKERGTYPKVALNLTKSNGTNLCPQSGPSGEEPHRRGCHRNTPRPQGHADSQLSIGS